MGLFGRKKALADDGDELLTRIIDHHRNLGLDEQGLAELRVLLMGAMAGFEDDPRSLGVIMHFCVKSLDYASARALIERAKRLESIEALTAMSLAAAKGKTEWLALDALAAAESLGFADGDEFRLGIYMDCGNVTAAIPLLERTVRDGDPGAAYVLGRLVEEEDVKRAIELYRVAYDAGIGDAALSLGVLSKDHPVGDDLHTWFDRAAELGSEQGLIFKAVSCSEEGDRAAGTAYLRRAIDEHDSADAMRELGVWEREAGNAETALDLFHRAAEGGNTTAMYDLGVFHEHRLERAEARDWYKRGAEAGDEDCRRALGVLDHAEGAGNEQLVEAAEGGDPEAMLHLSGNAFRAEDYEAARQWAHRAGEAGTPRGYTVEAIVVERQGNQAEADRLYLMAAELGDAGAMCNLGNNARNAGDIDAMRQWYTRAVDLGDGEAALRFADFERYRHFREPGFTEDDLDLGAAARWYEKAGSLGRAHAYGLLANLAAERGDNAMRDRAIHLGLAGVAGTFELIDVEAVAADNPDTMILAPRELRERQTVGAQVKLVWRDALASERMWTGIVKVDGDHYVGYLDNDPVDMSIAQGTLVVFGPEHILELAPPPEEATQRLLESLESGENPFTVRPTPYIASREVFEAAMAKAEAGDIDAIKQCFSFYQQSGNPDDPAAVLLLERGAALDDSTCIDLLGDHHEREGRESEAHACWHRAAGLGSSDSMYSLGCAAFDAGDHEQAKRWLVDASDADHARSAYLLAAVARMEDDADDDVMRWLQRSVELGSTEGMYELGAHLEARDDIDGARDLFERGAGLGSLACRRAVGVVALKQGQIETAMTHLRIAAEEGEPVANRILGRLANYEDEKIAHLTRAAELGDAPAMGMLGDAAKELGNMGDARMWWERAAEHGDANSFHSLGLDATNQDDHDAAADYWERGIAVDPNHGACLLSRSLLGLMRDANSEEMWSLMFRAVEVEQPQAMFYVGRELVERVSSPEPETGMDLVRRAAAAGSEEAAAFLSEHGEAP